MTFGDIGGREVFVVYCWLRHSVTIVGVTDGKGEAEALRDKFVADGGVDEDFTHARKNNTMIEQHFINKALKEVK